MRYVFQISLTVLLLATMGGAQTSEPSQQPKPEQSWENLSTLRVGEKIQVVDQKLKSQNGTFVGVSDEALTFKSDKDEVTVQRPDVFRVSSRERGHSRGRNALMGLAVGGGMGLGLGVAAAASHAEDIPLAVELVGWPLVFGGIGAGVGAALPAGHPTIYRAERCKDQTTP